MIETNLNPKEIESFIKSYYADFKNLDVNVVVENGTALVSNGEETLPLNSNDISYALSKYFESQNLGINNFNIIGSKETSATVRLTQLNRDSIKSLA